MFMVSWVCGIYGLESFPDEQDRSGCGYLVSKPLYLWFKRATSYTELFGQRNLNRTPGTSNMWGLQKIYTKYIQRQLKRHDLQLR